MNRGAGRRLVFKTPAHRAMFLQLLGEISTVYGIEIHAYCLMGNHYHLLACTPEAGLGRAMRHLNSVYTQRFNRSTGTDGPLYRGRYKAVLVGDDSHLCLVSRYIHLNPVEARLVDRPEAFAASSYRAYLGLDRAPSWLRTAETLQRFEPGDGRQSYRRFVESGIDEETRAFYARKRLRPVLGSDEFREDMSKRARTIGADSDPERPDAPILTGRLGLELVAAAVCRAFDISPQDLGVAAGRSAGARTARGAFVILGREVGGESLRAITRWVGYRSHAGASKAMSRMRTAIRRDPDVHDRLEAARRELTRTGRSSAGCPAKT